MPFNYPKTRKQDFIEKLHGQDVPDPYRWMEDLDSEEIKAWIDAQNEVTFDFLRGSPLREKIQNRMTRYRYYSRMDLLQKFLNQ